MIDGERIYKGQSWLVKEIVSFASCTLLLASTHPLSETPLLRAERQSGSRAVCRNNKVNVGQMN